MLSNDVLEIADRWWCRDFGCTPDELRPATTHVQAHAGTLVDATGIWILVTNAPPRISMPPHAFELIGHHARSWSEDLVSDHARLAAELLPLEPTAIIGPAPITYGTRDTLDLVAADSARELTPDDEEAVGRLQAACSDEAWDHGGSDIATVPTFGCFDERGDVLALAGYKTWNDEIAHIAIVTAPQQRGRGLGRAAVACAARHALDAGLLPQYRTLGANAPSVALAARLGFQHYGFSVYVRLPAETT